jgi:hypothetical protein
MTISDTDRDTLSRQLLKILEVYIINEHDAKEFAEKIVCSGQSLGEIQGFMRMNTKEKGKGRCVELPARLNRLRKDTSRSLRG